MSSVTQIAVDKIQVASEALRSQMNELGLVNLSESINKVGVLQPIIVKPDGDGYRLIVGARRLAACRRAELEFIPAIILSADAATRQLQLTENLQREDLNPVDRARAVQALMDDEKLSRTTVAAEIGVPRTTINDWLDILEVNERYQKAVLNNHYGGSSPLTLSHVTLAKRFAKRKQSPQLIEVVLDAVVYYTLSRAETKKVLKLVDKAVDLSIVEAVRKVRLIPQDKHQVHGESEPWNVDKLVSYLGKTGDYLVKTKLADIQALADRDRQDLMRQSPALERLLQDILAADVERPRRDRAKTS